MGALRRGRYKTVKGGALAVQVHASHAPGSFLGVNVVIDACAEGFYC